MATDDIGKKLQELEHVRTGLHEQINETVSVLGAVEQKIQELKARQQARIRSDDRIDNKIADQIAQGTSSVLNTHFGNHMGNHFLPAPHKSGQTEEKRIQLVPNGLTVADITVHPAEQDLYDEDAPLGGKDRLLSD